MRVSETKLRMVIQSLGFLLEGGVPLEEALFIMGETERNNRLSNFYRDMARKVIQGISFDQVLDQLFFSMKKEYRGLIQSGSTNGGIISALREIEIYLEHRIKNRETLIHALAYPVMLIILMTAGVYIFTHTVLPRALEFFESIPGNNSFLVDQLRERILWTKTWVESFLVILPSTGLIIFLWKKRPGERMGKIDLFLDRLTPGYFRDRELFFYLTSLTLLLDRGGPLIMALEKAGEGLSGALNRFKHRRIMNLIRTGEPAGLVLLNENFFPAPFSRWFAFSEMTGELNHGLALMRREFERRMIRRDRLIISLAEPVLICLSGGFLLFLATGFVLPLFEMMGGVP
jgi:general secretion pathway protein F